MRLSEAGDSRRNIEAIAHLAGFAGLWPDLAEEGWKPRGMD